MSSRKERRGTLDPQNVNGLITARTSYYRRELRRLIKGLFDVKCPKGWDREYILNLLVDLGYFAVANNTDVGVNAFRCGTYGVNYMNNPTKIIVNLPIIKNFTATIGEDAVLYYVENLGSGQFYNFGTKIAITAERLASADCSVDVNLINSRMGYIIEAETKAQSEAIKEMFDRISSGEPMVPYRKDVVLGSQGLKAFFGNVKQSYVANDVLDTKRTIVNEFLTSIGINNANTDKKERLITDEVEANNEEVEVYTVVWKENLQRANDEVKELFPGTEFSVNLRKFDRRTVAKTVDKIAGGGNDDVD